MLLILIPAVHRHSNPAAAYFQGDSVFNKPIKEGLLAKEEQMASKGNNDFITTTNLLVNIIHTVLCGCAAVRFKVHHSFVPLN